MANFETLKSVYELTGNNLESLGFVRAGEDYYELKEGLSIFHKVSNLSMVEFQLTLSSDKLVFSRYVDDAEMVPIFKENLILEVGEDSSVLQDKFLRIVELIELPLNANNID